MKLSTLNWRVAFPAFCNWKSASKKVFYRLFISVLIGLASFASQAQDPPCLMDRAYITFNLETAGRTSIEIFNLSGSKVVDVYNGRTEAGRQYTIEFNVADIADGVYLYRLVNGETVITDRMIISK